MSSAAGQPEGLEEAGAALWQSVLADVADGWQLDARDLALLEAACRAADRASQLDSEVERTGLMVAGSKGQPTLHPGVGEARQQRHLAATLLGKVEMSPPGERTGHLSARQRDQLNDARRRRWEGRAGHA